VVDAQLCNSCNSKFKVTNKPTIQLLDVVALPQGFGNLGKDSLGTVVEVLSDDAFMVEFIDDHGYTLAIETLRRDCLRKVWSLEQRVGSERLKAARDET
jgi:hypothetical protein